MKFTKLLVFFMLLSTGISFAQGPNPEQFVPGKGTTIYGKVIDKDSQQLMQYTNVALFSAKDSSLIGGGITNEKGQFSITQVTSGQYYLIAKFVGYDKKIISPIHISSSTKQKNLGTISLSPAASKLGSVEVVAKQPRVQYKIDKKVINVDQDVNAAGGNAIDALQNTPSIQVDMEGNVSLRGSTSFTVYIDGRPSILSSSDALQQIPSSAIQNIEIITNPSAKYDPDGNAGIINIVMKKNILSGFNGIVNVMGGTGDKRRIDLTINQKTKKRNISLGFNTEHRKESGDYDTYRETFDDDTTTYLNKTGDRNFIRKGFRLKGGLDLFLSEKTTLGFGVQGGQFNFDMNTDGDNFQYEDPFSSNDYTLNTERSTHDNNFVSGNINFTHKMNKDGSKKLEGSFQYRYRNGNDDSHNWEVLTDENYEITDPDNPVYDLYTRSSSGEKSNRYRLKVDYTQPLGSNGKLEAGVQGRIDNENEDYSFEDFDTETQTWINNEDFSSSMTFKRNIYSGYITFSDQLGQLKYMLGLRGEYTDRKIAEAGDDGVTAKINRFDLFPTLHFSYNITEDDQFLTSYSRRINRPRGWDLSPFSSYEDQYTIRTGNPALKPEFSNSLEAGYMKTLGKSFLSLEGFYRTTSDLITHVSSVGDDDIIYQSTENITNDHSLGGEAMGNVSITRWLMLNLNVSIYNYKLKGEIAGEDVSRESTNIDGRFNGTVNFSTNSHLQLTGNYQGKSVSAQGSRDPMYYVNLSYKHQLLDRKLSASLNLRDVFGTAKFKGTSETDNYYSAYEFKRDPRVVTLTLSFNLNSYKMGKSDSDNEI